MVIAVCVISGVFCFVVGVFFGLLPKNYDMTPEQKKSSNVMGLLVLGVILFEMFSETFDLASWVSIITAIVGYGVGKIPPLHDWAISKWTYFEPVKRGKRK